MKQNKLFKLWLLALILFAGSGVTWGATLISEGFSTTSLPSGWSGDVYFNTTANIGNLTGANGAGFNASNKYLQLPSVNSAGTLTFWMKGSAASSGISLKVQKSVGGGTFTDIATFPKPHTTTAVKQTVEINDASNNIILKIVAYDRTGNSIYLDDIVLSDYTASTPTISVSETSLSGFTYVVGSGPSAEQTFKLSGSNLTNDITVSAPTNYEISKTSGMGYSTPLTFTQSGGTVTEQTVYVRLKAGLSEGTYNNEIINISSTGATSKTVTCSGNVTAQPVTPEVSIALTSGSNPTCAGSSVSFTATPTNTGGGTVSYQWKVNGNNAGTNNAIFTSSGLQNNDQISCIITVTGGNVTTNTASSNLITMTVNTLPSTPMANNNSPVCVGSTLQLTSNATGTISWTGPNGFTSTEQNPVITNVTAAAAGTYYVTSNNGTCTSVAGSTVVTLNAAPAITTHPASVSKTVGSSHTFSVVATGSGLSYQWKLNGNDISGATGDSYTVSNITLAMNGNSYSVVVTGTCSPSVTSNAATLTVVELPCGGTESFTNSSISASYSSGSFTGDIVSWSYVYSRNEENYGITGKGCMFGPSNTAKLTSGSLSGIGNFTCKLKKGFTGAGTRQVGLYINGEFKGNSIAWDNTTTQTFTVNNINVAGNVVIEIRNLTNYQVVVDDISWTCYAPPVAPVAKDALNVSTTGFTANWNTVSGATSYKLDVTNQSNFTTDVTLIDENFVNCPYAISTDISSSLNTYLNTSGWTGSLIYGYGGYIRLGSGSYKGIITTPTLDLSNAESVTLSFDLGEYGTDASTIEVLHAADGSTFSSVTTIVAPSTITNQVVSITGGTVNSKIRIQAIVDANERFYLDNFKVVKTVSNCLSGYKDLTVNALSQAVTGLTNHTNYYYRVRALGANGTSSNSNVILVYTGENYRSKTNGSWNDLNTWEVSSDNNSWVAATELPSTTSSLITIQSGDAVEIVDNANVNTIIINPNGKLTLNNLKTLTTTKLVIESSNNGTGTYVDQNSGSSLPDITGTVNQYLITDRNWYLSSPVSAASVPAADNVWYYDETETNLLNSWKNATNPLIVGKGYIVNPTGAAVTVQFNGTLNTGNKSIGLTRTNENTSYKGFNLVGNPYPSYLNATTLLSVNNPTGNEKIESNIWYRTYDGSKHIFNTYNGPGSVSVPQAANPSYIPPMQSFWVRALADGVTLNFTNAMRMHNETANPILLRAPKATDRQLVRLNVSNGSVSDEMVIYSNENATAGLDKYDASKMMNTSNSSAAINLYTTVGSENLVIDGRNSLPLDVVIPVTFTTNAYSSGSYSISANELSNLPSGVTVRVIDNGVETSLNDGGTYTFTADAGTTKTFGLILRSPGAVTGVENGKADNFSVYANTNGQLVIMAPVKSTYTVYNAVGQLIQNGKLNSEHETLNTKLSSGVYVVKTENHSTRVIVK